MKPGHEWVDMTEHKRWTDYDRTYVTLVIEMCAKCGRIRGLVNGQEPWVDASYPCQTEAAE